MVGGWNPWRALRRRERARLHFRAMHPSSGGSAAVVTPAGEEHIFLDPGLDQPRRNAALAHEMVHLERGLLPHDAPPPLIAHEEARVRAETARRLVPLDELDPFLRARGEIGGVTLAEVCEEFGVPADVAVEALRQWRAA